MFNCIVEIAKTHGLTFQKNRKKIVKCTKKFHEKIRKKRRKKIKQYYIAKYSLTTLKIRSL